MIRFTILMTGVGLFTFALMNAVWTSLDGKERPGASLIADSSFLEWLTMLPNPFAADPSEYLLPPLGDVAGWERVDIADPWTVRPIRADGSIPTDSEMPAVIRQYSSDLAPDSFRRSMGTQKVKDGNDRSGGAARTGANYTNGTAVFNVVVERLREPKYVDPDKFNQLERYIYEASSVANSVLTAGTTRTEIGGLEFSNGLSGTQTRLRGTTHELSTVRGNRLIRIWGTGQTEDVEALVNGLFPALSLPLPTTD